MEELAKVNGQEVKVESEGYWGGSAAKNVRNKAGNIWKYEALSCFVPPG